MKIFKILVLFVAGLFLITSCRKDDLEVTNPTTENLVTQVITPEGGTINAPDGVQIIFPQGSVNANTEVVVGYTGNENFTIENLGANIIGKPFTLKIKVDTLQQNIQIKIPKPSGYIQNKTAIIASINPKIPLEFQEVGDFLIANFDNLILNISNEINSTVDGYQTIVIGIVTDIHLPMDAELGLKQVSIDNTGKMIFSNLSNITTNDKVLIMIHGWTSTPSSCWTEFLTKIQPQISQSGYSKFVTFGYYSGSPINNNGAVLAGQIQSQLNGATIDIVAHSMGGLVSRSAIENYNMANQIRNLITLGTPHKGSEIADLRQDVGRLFKTTNAYFNQSIDMGTQGLSDLQTNSTFIKELANNQFTPLTNYYPIAGISNLGGITINYDGVVSANSALGTPNNSNGNIGQVFSFNVFLPLNAVSIYQAVEMPHSKLKSDNTVIAHVASKLNSFNPVVPTNGLVAYYPFNGNANDASGNGNNGIVNGATLTTDRHGNANNAYSFDGVDDFIEIPNSITLQGSNAITISAWVKASSYSYTNGEYIPILEKSNTSESGSYMLGYSLSSNSLYASLGGNYLFSAVPVITLNQWHHIVVSISSSDSFFYLDGVKYSVTNNSSQSFNESMPLRIGQNTAGDNEILDGKLDNIRIYDRALSEAEILSLFNK